MRLISLLTLLALVGCDDDDDRGGEMNPDAETRADGTTPDGARPDGALDDGARPDGEAMDGQVMDGALDDGALPDGALPDGALDGGVLTVGAGTLTVALPTRDLDLWVLPEDGLLRLRYRAPGAAPAPDRGWTFDEVRWPEAPLSLDAEADEIAFSTATWSVHIDRRSGVVQMSDGYVTLEDRAPRGGDGADQLRLTLPPGAHLLGLGEKTGPVDKVGHRYSMWNTDTWYPERDYTPTKDPLYQSHPFVLGFEDGAAFGLYLASTWRSEFDLGASDPGEIALRSGSDEVDTVRIAGATPAKVLARYTALVGRPARPPIWALGYHQCRWSYVPEAEVRRIANTLRAKELPADTLWFDIDHMDAFRSFTWNDENFPNPRALIADLRAQGFKSVAIVDPGVSAEPNPDVPDPSYAPYFEGIRDGHFVTEAGGRVHLGNVWPGRAAFPDFSRPATREWWAGLVADFVSVGLAGIWIDMNEPATWEPAGFPQDARHDGEGASATHAEVHNVYASLMAKATQAGLRAAAPNERPFVLTRAGFAGIQRYAAVWTGDSESNWDHLAMAVPMLGNLGMSGVPLVGSDVGGYSGNPSAELYARWFAVGSLSPFFRNHVQSGSAAQEPWAFGEGVEQLARDHLRRRYALLPYLYAEAVRASETGAPVFRPLAFDFPEEARSFGADTQFMLGSELMAAPILAEGQRERPIHLPAGSAWVDFETGERLMPDAQGQITVAAPLYRVPLLARANAIIPTWPVRRSADGLPDRLNLELYPVAGEPERRFTQIYDDGHSDAYLSGVEARQTFALSRDAGSIRLTVSAIEGGFVPPHEALWLELHGVTAAPTAVSAGGVALPALTLDELETSAGFAYDSNAARLSVRLPFPQGGVSVQVEVGEAPFPARQVTVTLRVALPEGTPDGPLYVATNLNSWQPGAIALARVSPTEAAGELLVPEGGSLEYKFTRGGWDTVEKGAACEELNNRGETVLGDQSARRIFAHRVARFADSCE